jgi:CTP synthase (UTP-ammonia lyase)
VSDTVQIGIFGDYDPDSPTLPSIEKSIAHSAEKLKIATEAHWLATDSLLEPEIEKNLESFDGLWAAPGSPYKSFDGMLRGIEFARRRDWPFLGTCGGFQYALIECARNVLGMKDADSAENNSGSKNIIITPLGCAIPGGKAHAPKLSGAVPGIRIRPGSYLHSFYKQDNVTEEFFCSYEVNAEFEGAIIDAGFSIAARGGEGEVRAIEFPKNKFFIATLFQPQLSSKPGKPHPIVMEFLLAASKCKARKLEDSVLES